MKIKISKSTISMVESINNGRLSMLINIQMSPPKENSTLTLVFMLKEISMSSQNLKKIDTLTLSITEIWLSRLQMVERLRSGTSINNLLQLEQD
jgi:hypothetical protein